MRQSSFFRVEKSVAWIDKLFAFCFTNTFSSDESYLTLAKKAQAFYN